MADALSGCEDLREWLRERGFKVSKDPLGSQGNECNWYAYKRTDHEARECECNEGKRMQVLIRPFSYVLHGDIHESSEIELTGEVGGLWFTLKAYGVKHAELKKRVEEIERMLIDAWNALLPPRDER